MYNMLIVCVCVCAYSLHILLILQLLDYHFGSVVQLGGISEILVFYSFKSITELLWLKDAFILFEDSLKYFVRLRKFWPFWRSEKLCRLLQKLHIYKGNCSINIFEECLLDSAIRYSRSSDLFIDMNSPFQSILYVRFFFSRRTLQSSRRVKSLHGMCEEGKSYLSGHHGNMSDLFITLLIFPLHLNKFNTRVSGDFTLYARKKSGSEEKKEEWRGEESQEHMLALSQEPPAANNPRRGILLN